MKQNYKIEMNPVEAALALYDLYQDPGVHPILKESASKAISSLIQAAAILKRQHDTGLKIKFVPKFAKYYLYKSNGEFYLDEKPFFKFFEKQIGMPFEMIADAWKALPKEEQKHFIEEAVKCRENDYGFNKW